MAHASSPVYFAGEEDAVKDILDAFAEDYGAYHVDYHKRTVVYVAMGASRNDITRRLRGGDREMSIMKFYEMEFDPKTATVMVAYARIVVV